MVRTRTRLEVRQPETNHGVYFLGIGKKRVCAGIRLLRHGHAPPPTSTGSLTGVPRGRAKEGGGNRTWSPWAVATHLRLEVHSPPAGFLCFTSSALYRSLTRIGCRDQDRTLLSPFTRSGRGMLTAEAVQPQQPQEPGRVPGTQGRIPVSPLLNLGGPLGP